MQKSHNNNSQESLFCQQFFLCTFVLICGCFTVSMLVFGLVDTHRCVWCRWGNTPMDEAVHFGHHDVVTILRDYHTQYSPQESPNSDVEKQNAEKNLDGMLWGGWT